MKEARRQPTLPQHCHHAGSRFYSRKNMPPVLTPKNSNDTTNDSTDAFCICRQGETDTMVACDNQNCPYKWFHLSCLKLTKSQLPKGKWFCPDCSRLPEFVPKRRCSRKWLWMFTNVPLTDSDHSVNHGCLLCIFIVHVSHCLNCYFFSDFLIHFPCALTLY